MSKHESIKSRLADILYSKLSDKRSDSDSAFFRAQEIADSWSNKKHKTLVSQLQDNLDNSPEFLPKEDYLATCEMVIGVVETVLASGNEEFKARHFFGENFEKQFAFFKEHYKEWEFYGRKLGKSYGESFDISEDFHHMECVANDAILNHYIKEIAVLIRKDTKKSRKELLKMHNTVYQLRSFIDYFWHKDANRARAREMFLNRRKFKKTKKRLFVFDLKAEGSNWFIDWPCPENDAFLAMVSHIDETNARNSIARKREDYDRRFE